MASLNLCKQIVEDFSEHIQNFYDNKWNKLDFTYVCEKNDIIDIKPEKYEEMITLAEKLSSQFPFVRVDFYYVNNKIYFWRTYAYTK